MDWQTCSSSISSEGNGDGAPDGVAPRHPTDRAQHVIRAVPPWLHPGHVNPEKAADPGLVYDIAPDGYGDPPSSTVPAPPALLTTVHVMFRPDPALCLCGCTPRSGP
jgi:hypothetical protein